jgi:SAM-dependent methyltransferase
VEVTTDKVSKKRWLAAHEREMAGIKKAEDVREWLRVRRVTWPNLMDYLKDNIDVKATQRILDIGGGPTSIFLALNKGEKYLVDPVYQTLFQGVPFMRDIEEYKDVHFLACTIEEAVFDKPFDLIFTINSIDHVGDLNSVVKKIDELLVSGGTLVVIVDCYADNWVRNIVRFFDADVPHPHHFLVEDIIRLFPAYKLKKRDNKIYELIEKPAFRGESGGIPIYRIDKFIGRMRQDLRDWGKSRDILFAMV